MSHDFLNPTVSCSPFCSVFSFILTATTIHWKWHVLFVLTGLSCLLCCVQVWFFLLCSAPASSKSCPLHPLPAIFWTAVCPVLVSDPTSMPAFFCLYLLIEIVSSWHFLFTYQSMLCSFTIVALGGSGEAMGERREGRRGDKHMSSVP